MIATMAEYTATGPGAATNGMNMNGSGDTTGFAPPAPMPSTNEAAKTLW